MKKIFLLLIAASLASCETDYKVHKKAPVLIDQTVEMKGETLSDTIKQENNKYVQGKEIEDQGRLLKEAGDGLK